MNNGTRQIYVTTIDKNSWQVIYKIKFSLQYKKKDLRSNGTGGSHLHQRSDSEGGVEIASKETNWKIKYVTLYRTESNGLS